MLYLDSVPNVELGVLLGQPCPLTGRVVASALPAGTAAMTVHRGRVCVIFVGSQDHLRETAGQAVRV
jgi:hypothetical protein